MKNVKNVLFTGLSLVLVAALAIGSTVAWLNDEDSDVNVMALGNVSIEQHEYERKVNADGTYVTDTVDEKTSYVLQDFTQAKPLLPIVGDPSLSGNDSGYAGWDTTTVRMSQVDSYGGMQVFAGKNAQDKFVTVENTGETDAYVRTLVAIEIGDGNASLVGSSYHQNWTRNSIGKIEIDGNNYYLFEYVYKGASDNSRHVGGILPAGDTSYPSLSQVYLKSAATNEDCEALDGNDNGTLDILVLSQAVQAEGFADAETALNEAFGVITTTDHPWTDGAEIPTVVSSASDLKAALSAGKKNIVAKGVTISENFFNGHYYIDRNIDFVDCTFTANMNYMYINDATFTNCTFDCGSANSAVHYDELHGDLVFNNCTFTSGKVQLGTNDDMTATITFNDCEFAETSQTSIWSDKDIRVYSPAEFNNCEFNNRVVMAGSNGLSVTFNSCTMNDGTPVYYIDNSNGIIRGGNIPDVTINGATGILVNNVTELQTALHNAVDGDTIILNADITGDVTVTQKSGVKITIDGVGKTYAGVITVDGKSATYTTAGLTIKNINFEAESISKDACVRLGDGTNTTRYTCNVTVDNCIFDVPGAVGVKSYTGGDKNLSVLNCTATVNAHSLVQAKGIDGVRVENCTVLSKNGMNFNNSDQVTVIGCTVNTQGYCVRFGESSGGSGAAETYRIENCSLTSACDDGDAAIILRGTADNATLTIRNTTISAATEITNNATGATVIR